MGSCVLEGGRGRKECTVIMLHHLGAVHPDELGTKSRSRSPYRTSSYRNMPVEGRCFHSLFSYSFDSIHCLLCLKKGSWSVWTFILRGSYISILRCLLPLECIAWAQARVNCSSVPSSSKQRGVGRTSWLFCQRDRTEVAHDRATGISIVSYIEEQGGRKWRQVWHSLEFLWFVVCS